MLPSFEKNTENSFGIYLFVSWPILAPLRAYFWLCGQESLLTGIRGLYRGRQGSTLLSHGPYFLTFIQMFTKNKDS